MSNLDVQPCTNCRSKTNIQYLFSKSNDGRGSNDIKIYQCKSCQTVFLGQFKEFFENELYEYYEKYIGKNKEQIFDPITAKSYAQVLQKLRIHCVGDSILDVGCGSGGFVDVGLSEGYKINGIELSQSAVDIAKSFNLPVQKLDFFSEKIKHSSIDILTMFEVIEHLPNPFGFIKRAEEVVKPGGVIYLTTPNYNSLDRRFLREKWDVFHREHLTYFTLKTLINGIQCQTKLKIVHMETRNISTQLLNYFRNIPEQKCSNEIESNVARNTIYKYRVLSDLKRLINYFLKLTSLGSTIVIILKRPNLIEDI